MPSDKTSRASAPKRSNEGANGHRDKRQNERASRHWVPLPALPHPSVSMPGGLAGNVIWLGGLAAVAAFGVVDWPVVALVAAGTWVAEQHIKQSRQPAQT